MQKSSLQERNFTGKAFYKHTLQKSFRGKSFTNRIFEESGFTGKKLYRKKHHKKGALQEETLQKAYLQETNITEKGALEEGVLQERALQIGSFFFFSTRTSKLNYNRSGCFPETVLNGEYHGQKKNAVMDSRYCMNSTFGAILQGVRECFQLLCAG